MNASQTLSTGGQCIALSTPNGVGNWFHKTWVGAEDGTNDWNTIKLHWNLHQERDDEWRKEQDKLLCPSLAAQSVIVTLLLQVKHVLMVLY